MADFTQDTGFENRHFAAPDGLNIHVRLYGTAREGVLPTLCLPGLTRNAADFHHLALVLSQDRQVICITFRGRGLSDHDPDPSHYAVPVEAGDVLAVLAQLGVQRAIFIGTSRGGIVTMGISTVAPDLIAGVVLNDIGPVLEARGIARIKSYVGKAVPPSDWPAAIAAVKRLNDGGFPNLSEAEWARFTHQLFIEKDGRPVAAYDPALAETLAAVDPAQPIPDLWDAFAGLDGKPLMVIRGGLSDLLSADTVEEMERRHKGRFLAYTIPDQAHAPLLNDVASIGDIRHFVNSIT